jgi:hypothetical protein
MDWSEGQWRKAAGWPAAPTDAVEEDADWVRFDPALAEQVQREVTGDIARWEATEPAATEGRAR